MEKHTDKTAHEKFIAELVGMIFAPLTADGRPRVEVKVEATLPGKILETAVKIESPAEGTVAEPDHKPCKICGVVHGRSLFAKSAEEVFGPLFTEEKPKIDLRPADTARISFLTKEGELHSDPSGAARVRAASDEDQRSRARLGMAVDPDDEPIRYTLPDRLTDPFTSEGLVEAVEIITRDRDDNGRLLVFAAMLGELQDAVQWRAEHNSERARDGFDAAKRMAGTL